MSNKQANKWTTRLLGGLRKVLYCGWAWSVRQSPKQYPKGWELACILIQGWSWSHRPGFAFLWDGMILAGPFCSGRSFPVCSRNYWSWIDWNSLSRSSGAQLHKGNPKLRLDSSCPWIPLTPASPGPLCWALWYHLLFSECSCTWLWDLSFLPWLPSSSRLAPGFYWWGAICTKRLRPVVCDFYGGPVSYFSLVCRPKKWRFNSLWFVFRQTSPISTMPSHAFDTLHVTGPWIYSCVCQGMLHSHLVADHRQGTFRTLGKKLEHVSFLAWDP